MSACSTITNECVSPGSDGHDLRGNPRSADATGSADLPPIPPGGGDGGGETKPALFAVGDVVHAGWTTATGKYREVMGKVKRLRPSKAGERVLIEYERTTMSGRNFSWGVHEVWRLASQCKLVERGNGEVPSAGRDMAMALIGMERDRCAEAKP
jgi:hypothetical protein